GSETPSLTAAAAPEQAAAAPRAGAPSPAFDQNALIQQASRDFTDYQQLTSQGRLAEAGQKLDDLKRTLDQLSAHAK
ncbi:MAG: hypothetical protein WBL41_14055, partial [Terracidiphilus sp.]